MPKAKKEQKASGTPGQGLAGATLGCALGFAGVSLFGPTAKRLRVLLDLSDVQTSLLIAIPSLSGSLLRVPFGASVDGTGGRAPLLVLLAASIVGMAGLALVLHRPDEDLAEMEFLYPVLLLLGVLVGCGIAIFVVGAGQASYWYPKKKQGRVLGFYGGVGNLPPGFVSLVLPFALEGLGLFKTYLIWLLALVAGSVVYFMIGRNAWYFQLKAAGKTPEAAEETAREMGQELFPTGSAGKSLMTAACNPKTWALVALYFVSFGGFLALTTWFPTFWMELYEVAATQAGALTAMFSLLSSVVRATLGGILSDALGGEASLVGGLSVTAIGALIITLSQATFGADVFGTVLLAIGMGICNGSCFKLVPQSVPEAIGGASGWVGGLGAFGGFALPPIAALFVTSQGKPGYSYGFVIYPAMIVPALGVVALLWHTKRKKEAAAQLEAEHAEATAGSAPVACPAGVTDSDDESEEGSEDDSGSDSDSD